MAKDRKRRLAALFAAFALALQSFLSADVLAAIAIDSGAFRTVTICTGDGYKQITLDADNNPVAPPLKDGARDCPACVLASCCLLALPADGGATLVDVPPREAAQFKRSLRAGSRSPLAPQSRAPPPGARS